MICLGSLDTFLFGSQVAIFLYISAYEDKVLNFAILVYHTEYLKWDINEVLHEYAKVQRLNK